MRKFALDSNCYIEASRDAAALGAMQEFVAKAAPGLYISSIVAAELLGGARSVRDRKVIEDRVLGPFMRHGRIFAPSAAAWDALGRTLAILREREGLQLSQVSRSFTFDVVDRQMGITPSAIEILRRYYRVTLKPERPWHTGKIVRDFHALFARTPGPDTASFGV